MKKTKAVILAGGLGTRLRPITCTRPKPMCRILDETVLERLIKMLPKYNINEAVISTMYMSEYISDSLGDKYMGVTLKYVKEDEPFGSAGGVRFASRAFSDENYDSLLVLSGDGVFDFDLSDVLEFHSKKCSDVTIVTTTKNEPTEYGVIIADKENRITSFHEKPSWNHVRSDTVNTGIYVLNSSILKLIPEGRSFDFSGDLFPHLLGIGRKMYSFRKSGYWCDIGDISSYYMCNNDALSGKIRDTEYTDRSVNHSNSFCYISKLSNISNTAAIKNYSVIHDHVYVGDNSVISASLIFEGTKIGKNVIIKNSIICENTIIEDNSLIMQGCVIGAGSTIESNVTLNAGITIWPGKTIEKGFFVTQDVIFKNNSRNIYADDGYSAGCIDQPVDTEYITRLGRAISSALYKSKTGTSSGTVARIGVIHDGTGTSALIAETLLCAIKSSGSKGFSFLKGFEAQARFVSSEYMTDAILYVTSKNNNRIIKVFEEPQATVKENLERMIESEYKNPSRSETTTIYDTGYIDSLQFHYYSYLLKKSRADKIDLNNYSFKIYNSEVKHTPSNILSNVLKECRGKVNQKNIKNDIIISISDDGTQASIQQTDELNRTVNFDTFHIVAALKNYERNYNNEKTDTLEILSDVKYTSNYDMCFSIIKLLCIINKSGKSLYDLFKSLPSFEIKVQELTTEDIGSEKRAITMKKLYSKYTSSTNMLNNDGINLIFENGSVTVVPKRTGGFKIIAEAVNCECADEIISRIKHEIKNI